MIKLIFLFLFSLSLYANNINEYKIINLSIKKNLYKSSTFKNLLFYKDKFYIQDKKFYLSSKKNLKDELVADIKGFFKNKNQFKNINNHPQCKFPARFLFIRKELNISKNIFPNIKCPDFEEYKKKAPANNIYIIFASANLKDPSSMMGHTFFKFEGKNYKNKKVTHAISFFTFINTLDPLKLIYENIGPGMKGIFVLRPYKDILYNYLENENRNVWEYKLKLNKFQKKFLYYHIWELRNIKMKYYFTSFNCSTVDLFILASIKPELMHNYKYYISPLDLVKLINKKKLIEKSNLLPSDEWFIKLTEEQLDFFTIYKIKMAIKNKDIKSLQKLNNYYSKLLAKLYAIYLFKHHNLSENDLDIITKNIKLKNSYIDISKYKNPLKTPYQRQIGIGYFKDYDRHKYMTFNFLPASHTLNDDNREYFNESELKLANLKILVNKNKILLENFDIYTMENLIPFDILTKPISYNFSLNLKRDYTKELNKKLFLNLKAGIGEDIKLDHDINLYFLLDAKLRYHKKTNFLVTPNIGAMIYTIGKGKILFDYSKIYSINSFLYNKFSLSYNIYINNLKLYSKYSLVENLKKEKELEFGIEKYF